MLQGSLVDPHQVEPLNWISLQSGTNSVCFSERVHTEKPFARLTLLRLSSWWLISSGIWSLRTSFHHKYQISSDENLPDMKAFSDFLAETRGTPGHMFRPLGRYHLHPAVWVPTVFQGKGTDEHREASHSILPTHVPAWSLSRLNKKDKTKHMTNNPYKWGLAQNAPWSSVKWILFLTAYTLQWLLRVLCKQSYPYQAPGQTPSAFSILSLCFLNGASCLPGKFLHLSNLSLYSSLGLIWNIICPSQMPRQGQLFGMNIVITFPYKITKEEGICKYISVSVRYWLSHPGYNKTH